MQAIFAAGILIVLVGMVIARVGLMRRSGIRAMKFGARDRTDFLIPPFALFFIYLVCANAFYFPLPTDQRFFHSAIVSWIGVGLCGAGLLLMVGSLASFGKSFRVGIDSERPDKLVTTGLFGLSRNPIYVAFFLILAGEFLVFSDWILLAYVVAGSLLFHRQVVREETFLRSAYGRDFEEYCKRVRRYI